MMTNLSERRLQAIREAIDSHRTFRFCAPSDDPDRVDAVTLGYRHVVIQLQRLASRLLTEPTASRLNSLDVEVDNIYSAFDAHSEIEAIILDIEDAIESATTSIHPTSPKGEELPAMIERFSHREGHRPTAAQITVREDAPPALRGAIPMIAKEAGMRPSAIRRVICQVLLVPEDLDNWSEYPNIWGEVVQLINDARWYQVYDIAEALYPEFDITFDSQPQPGARFQQRLNDFLVENGIGWQLQDGKITRRGSEAFDRSTHEVPKRLEESGFQRVANEMREALRDISRRPQADITGAIQHAMAALEATAREVAGQPNPTLGKLIPALNLPAPLDQAVHKLWGYASEYGRHIREQQDVDHAQAELIVTVAGSLCAFLAQRQAT